MDFKKQLLKTLTLILNDIKKEDKNGKEDSSIEVEIRLGKLEDNKFISRINLDNFNIINQKFKTLNIKYEDNVSLDIITSISQEETERITLQGLNKIKSYCKDGVIDKDVLVINKKRIITPNDSLSNYNIRIGVSKETIKKEILNVNESVNKTFRYKNRRSYIIGNIRFDLTIVKDNTGTSMLDLLSKEEKYEIECEIINPKIDLIDDDIDNIYNLLLWRTESFVLLPSDKLIMIYDEFSKLVGLKNFKAPKVKGFKKENLLNTDELNNYAVTYKVDGVHHLLYVDSKGDIYLIDDNGNVKYTGYKHNSKYSIYDCELLDNNIFIFDCLFSNSKDVRKLSMLTLNDEIIKPNNMFQSDIKKVINEGTRFGFIEEFLLIPPSSEYNIDLLIKAKKYLNDKSTFFNKCDVLLNNKIDIDIDGLIIVKYADPYPIDSKIVTFDNIFKYKPLDKLSIDFLVNISETKIISNGFECKRVKLIVSAMGGTKYVEFATTELPIKDDALRTLDNNIITNNSVVEFIYDVNASFKWVPYRLRPDKTVKKAPNAIRTAQETYKLIIDPITQDMITGKEKVTLTNAELYRTGTDQERQMVKNLREYHNQIKTDLIKYASEYNKSNNIKLIDLACGAGGDLHKFNNSNVTYLTGIDKFEDTIREARIRFTDLRKISLKEADFFQGDLTLPIEDCAKGNDSSILNKVLSKYIGDYDIANCQFAIHYFFKNNDTLDTFLSNVHKTLKMGGLFIGTTLNGNVVNNKFNTTKGEPIIINSDNDASINLYTIKRIYKLTDKVELGCNIVPKIAGLTDNIEEWLVNFDLFQNICKDYGFEIIKLNDLSYGMTFEEISKLPKYKEYVNKMSKAEKEYSFMHSIFMFKKVGQINKRLVTKSTMSMKPTISLKSMSIKPTISLKPSISLTPTNQSISLKTDITKEENKEINKEINKETNKEIIKEIKPISISLKQPKKLSISLKKE